MPTVHARFYKVVNAVDAFKCLLTTAGEDFDKTYVDLARKKKDTLRESLGPHQRCWLDAVPQSQSRHFNGTAAQARAGMVI